eukprot:988131-Prymnesium_polylepis.3
MCIRDRRLLAIEAAASNFDDHNGDLLARRLKQLNQAPRPSEHALGREKDDRITPVHALADQVAKVIQSAAVQKHRLFHHLPQRAVTSTSTGTAYEMGAAFSGGVGA